MREPMLTAHVPKIAKRSVEINNTQLIVQSVEINNDVIVSTLLWKYNRYQHIIDYLHRHSMNKTLFFLIFYNVPFFGRLSST